MLRSRKTDPWLGEKESIETDPDMSKMMKIAEKQIKTAITKMYQCLKEGINIIGNRYKVNKVEFLEPQNTILEMKNSLHGFNNR